MRFLKILTIACAFVSSGAVAQFRSEQAENHYDVRQSVMRSSDGLLFGWLDLSRLSMHHSYSLSYSSFGGQGLSLGMYTNSLMYKISDPLDVRFDVSLMHSPYSSFGNRSDFSGVFLNRAELNYRPSENMLLQIQFRQVPPMYWLDPGFSSRVFGGYQWDHHEEDR